MRVLIRALLSLVCIALAALALYTIAAFGALLFVPEPTEPEGGIVIYACDNGVHTDLVVPVAAGHMDWRAVFAADAFTGPVAFFDHIGLGWGSRDFYINTPTWADVDIGRALKSVLWDETVLHVEYRPKPSATEKCRQWPMDAAAYGRIVDFVRGSLRQSQGRPVQAAPGYGERDTFYVANGRYTIIETCNQWTARALRLGGAPVAPWTPFSFLVLWNMPMISS
ncbi:TIGR02117 family protein [Dongia deserti]|uniref:TIGR02117 family protein n=1 Tax=Dongia deserti TaxID=2268030 RepID=UPI000E64AB54|nr:TIGR02117 family protein [Dongia deserti]